MPSGGGDSEGADVDDLDSDVDCMEGLDGEVVAVRTWALEEQATACQMILLLAEALQVKGRFVLPGMGGGGVLEKDAGLCRAGSEAK